MEVKKLIDSMFPYYEDMSDIEMVQTTSRRVGAEKMAEELIRMICDWIVENNLRYPNPNLGSKCVVSQLKNEFKI